VSNPYVAEIRIFPFDFAPVGWAQCNGQLLPISQNAALFSLIGTFYGGNGTTNFALPDLQGRIPIDAGQGTGLSPYPIGDSGGAEQVTLLSSMVPGHTHTLQANAREAELNNPGPHNSLARSKPVTIYKTPSSAVQPLASGVLGAAVGGNQPHANVMPYLTLNVCIALQGVFPARS
jgi:microcystin-dependent protein